MKPVLRKGFVVAVCAALVPMIGTGIAPAAHAANSTSSAVTKSKTVTRINLDNGTDTSVDSRSVSVTVSDTQDLRDRQGVTVSWTGAHPTGGLYPDKNSVRGAYQEYPVVVMECRGVDSDTAPASKQVSPQTCWTQTPTEHFQYSGGSIYPPYRMDRYAPAAGREMQAYAPNPLPAGCQDLTAPHWVPFVGADGTRYNIGPNGCAGMPAEMNTCDPINPQSNCGDSLQPGSTTYGATDTAGKGSIKFVMQNADSNASLGCSNTVACTLEVIPIEGISCDPAGTAPAPGGMPATDRPDPSALPFVQQDCEATGHFAPGAFNGSAESPDLAVTGLLWWSESNWRNRISIPLTFAPSASVCDVVNSSATVYMYGAESLLQATQQWAPSFCLNSSLFNLRHVQTSEPQAKNLLSLNNIESAIQSSPPSTPFGTPTVQAPAAVTGWGIAFSIDDQNGHPVTTLKLNARLLAKLMSESYRSCPGDCLPYDTQESRHNGFAAMKNNPLDIEEDPEFEALNPGVSGTLYPQSAAALSFMSSDSDLMYALTSYINADPEARSWLDGNPDPWGMYVNPAYQGIQLPVYSWPLLDTHLVTLGTGANTCLEQQPVPWLPLVASPILNPSIIALDMQFDIANSQTNCKGNGTPSQKLGAIGRQIPGSRFLVGLVSLADARRYQLNVAALQTQRTSTGNDKFSDAKGRSFVAPTDDAMRQAASMFVANDSIGSWTVPYDAMRTSAQGKAAYPGTVLISIDVPTHGLPKADAPRYAKLLRFVAGTGQQPGTGNGQLADGYVPLTAANGLARFATYTDAAADAVQAQQCMLPLPSGKPATTKPCTGGGGGTVVVPSGGGSTPTSTPTSSGTGKPTTKPNTSGTPTVVAVGNTRSVGSGALGWALPTAALFAIVALLASALTSGVGRRQR